MCYQKLLFQKRSGHKNNKIILLKNIKKKLFIFFYIFSLNAFLFITSIQNTRVTTHLIKVLDLQYVIKFKNKNIYDI